MVLMKLVNGFMSPKGMVVAVEDRAEEASSCPVSSFHQTSHRTPKVRLHQQTPT